jgi:hypothetical protein
MIFPTAKELAHAALSEAGWVELTPWLVGPGPKAMLDRPQIASWHYGWNAREAVASGYYLSLRGSGALAQARYVVHLSVCPRHEICPFLVMDWENDVNEEVAEQCRAANHERYHGPPTFEDVCDFYLWYLGQQQP